MTQSRVGGGVAPSHREEAREVDPEPNAVVVRSLRWVPCAVRIIEPDQSRSERRVVVHRVYCFRAPVLDALVP